MSPPTSTTRCSARWSSCAGDTALPCGNCPWRRTGPLDLAAAEAAFRAQPPTLVAASAVSNVTGYILPAPELFRLARPYGAFTLLDASQALGLVKLRFSQLHADAVAFAGHKTLYGPFGAAGFFLREGAQLRELLSGGTGTQSLRLEMPRNYPDRLESGSKDTVALAGLDAALGWLRTVDPLARERELTGYLLERLNEIKGIHLYTAPAPERQAGVVSLNIDGFRANEVAAILDDRFDIAVRAGHHCAALLHAHLDDRAFDGTVRVSLGYFNTREDIDALAAGLKTVDREMLKGIDDGILRGNC
jgi:selenocysteine lyase/cysteine desulfurase